MSMKNSNNTIRNRTRDLLAFSAVPQPTTPPNHNIKIGNKFFKSLVQFQYFGMALTNYMNEEVTI
jgi:hypothetical protein